MKKIIVLIVIIIVIAILVVCNSIYGNTTSKDDSSLPSGIAGNVALVEHPIPADDKETLANEINTDIPRIEIVRGKKEIVDVEVQITNNSDYLRGYALETVTHEGNIPCEDIEVYANDVYIGNLNAPGNNSIIGFDVAPHLEKAKLSFRLKNSSTGDNAKIKVKYYSFGRYYYDYNFSNYIKEAD